MCACMCVCVCVCVSVGGRGGCARACAYLSVFLRVMHVTYALVCLYVYVSVF